MTGDDELEARLRRVLRDARVTAPSTEDTLRQVHAGVAARRRRRTATLTSGVAVVAVALGVTLLAHPFAKGDTGHQVADAHLPGATQQSTQPAEPVTPPITPPPSAMIAPDLTTTPPLSLAGFTPVSVTAVSRDSFWVLGARPCDGAACAALKFTGDGGKTFTDLAVPQAQWDRAVDHVAALASTFSGVRFGSSHDGWIFGGGLWATHDGGHSWTDVAMPGPVVSLGAAAGTAWALVRESGSAKNAKDAADTTDTKDAYGLYRSDFAGGADTWTRVSTLPILLGPDQPQLAVQGGTVYVTAKAADVPEHVLVSTDHGATFQDRPGPCNWSDGGSISSTAGALWAACPGDDGHQVWVSTDDAAHWTSVATGADTRTTSIGARSASDAIVTATGTSGVHLWRVSVGKDATPVATSGTPAPAELTVVGFTVSDVGYALEYSPSGGSLLRTTDGGSTWHSIGF